MAEKALRRRAEPTPRTVRGLYPRLTKICDWPRIYVIDHFVDATCCTHLAEVVAHVASMESSGQAVRDSAGWAIEVPWSWSPVITALASRMQALLDFQSTRSSTLRFRSYLPGESHPPHPDHFEIDGHWLIATAMLCVEAGVGGETVFPYGYDPIAITPRAGRLSMWFNHVKSGQPDPLSVHYAAPVLDGAKTTLTLFAYADPEQCTSLHTGIVEAN